MRHHTILLLCVLTLACGGAQPAPEPPFPRAEVSFFLSSLTTRYAIRGDFWGTTLIAPTTVEVRVDSTRVRRPQGKNGEYGKVWLRAALAMRTKASWRIIARSEPLTILDGSPAGTSLTPPLRFTIKRPRSFDSQLHYLTFEYSFEGRRSDGEPPDIATTYVCGMPGMLVAPVSVTHTDSDPC